MTAPLNRTLVTDVAAAAAGAEAYGVFQPAPFASVVTAASVIPMAAITGANTDSRTFNLYNRTRTKTIATLAMVSGVNAVDNTPLALTLSGTADNLVVNAGDVLELESLHIGGTGLAAPQLKGVVTLGRS